MQVPCLTASGLFTVAGLVVQHSIAYGELPIHVAPVVYLFLGLWCECLLLSVLPAQRRRKVFLAKPGVGAKAAMTVGSLVSSRPPEQLLPMARQGFRCVSLDRVTKAMMVDNRPNPELRDFTEAAALGAVDAFVSHSWSDDADAKWAALQAWRADFRRAAGREPRVWLDKFCLDQSSIRESLASLPIYVAGCDKFLVLLGETYQTRLWCLLEMLAFIATGGSRENLVVQPLSRENLDFEKFDARGATCSDESDRGHLLGIIETGLGTIDRFNNAVRDMVGGRTASPPCVMGSPAEPVLRAAHA